MKFAIVALLASSSAIRIRSLETADKNKGCISHRMARNGFADLDTNHNGSLSYEEIKVGLEELSKKMNHTITEKEWEWIEATGKKIDSKTPGKVDEEEFWEFANAIFEHFDLCKGIEREKKERRQRRNHRRQQYRKHRKERREHECVDHELAKQGFRALDTNHNGSLSYEEIKVGLEDLAKNLNHTITKKEWEWIEATGKKIDSKTPGKVDEEEFYHFANAIFKHFDLCKLAREGDREIRREDRRERREHECVDHELADEGFRNLDTNHNGSLSYEEIKVGLEQLAKSQNHVITKKEWEWIEATGKKIDSKTPGKVDKHEFYEFANAVFKHFGLCNLAREADDDIRRHDEQENKDGCIDHEMAKQGFRHLDTNHNGSLSYEEIKVGLEQLAKSQNHVLSKKEWEWIEATVKKIDSKTPGKVDEEEFYLFANALFKHFGLCKNLRKEDRREHHRDISRGPCDLTDSEAKEAFSAIDTNHNGIVGWEEVKASFEEVAKESGKQFSQEDKKYIEKHYNEDQNKTGSGLDEREFHEFANQVSNHFDFCGAKK